MEDKDISALKVTTKQKKKKRWAAETAYIVGEAETRELALRALVSELRFVASELEDLLDERRDGKD